MNPATQLWHKLLAGSKTGKSWRPQPLPTVTQATSRGIWYRATEPGRPCYSAKPLGLTSQQGLVVTRFKECWLGLERLYSR